MMENWKRTDEILPPEGRVVETKIEDEKGTRNRCDLVKSGGLWFFPDGSMYVYYTPTHWRMK
jgi:hypothetical protein